MKPVRSAFFYFTSVIDPGLLAEDNFVNGFLDILGQGFGLVLCEDVVHHLEARLPSSSRRASARRRTDSCRSASSRRFLEVADGVFVSRYSVGPSSSTTSSARVFSSTTTPAWCAQEAQNFIADRHQLHTALQTASMKPHRGRCLRRAERSHRLRVLRIQLAYPAVSSRWIRPAEDRQS